MALWESPGATLGLMRNRQMGALSSPHALGHEAVLGRTVKRLALRAHCFASAGVPFALFHEAHLYSAVKRLAVRAHRLAVAGLRRCRTDREAGNQRRRVVAVSKLEYNTGKKRT